MSEENKAGEENSKRKIPFFDETASVLDEGGEIDVILVALFEACKAKNLPLIAAINYKVKDNGKSFDAEVRGTQVGGKDGFTIVSMQAMAAVMNNKQLAHVVLSIAKDKSKMDLLSMLDPY